MTNKQLCAVKDELNKKYYGDKPRFSENLKMPISEEDERRFEELRCIEMINSCLTYGDDPFRVINKWWYGHGYCDRSYMSDYEEKLGVERVRELVDEQKQEFARARIIKGTYTDSEGVMYNTVIFADDEK